MVHTTIAIDTPDGVCSSQVFHPEGSGPWPAVLIFMDAMGIRPSMLEIAERVAGAGYYVLLPNLFYRLGDISLDAQTMFLDADKRVAWTTRVLPSVVAPNIMRDTGAFLQHFDESPLVRHGKIGVMGFCMGGRLALNVAGYFGDRIAAAASFHGGGMATDHPDSPHLLASQMTAKVLVAGAANDSGFDDAQKERLERALTDAGVDYTVETYAARHGWMPTDTPVHKRGEAERGWTALFALLHETLG